MNERALQERESVLVAYDKLHPGIIGNPFIPHWPTPQQSKFLGAHLHYEHEGVFEALYGGAAGGGKSDALLMGAAQYAWLCPEFAGVCLRRSYAELAQPGALMDRAMKWWRPLGVQWDGTNKLFTFPSGARVKMAYHGHPADDLQFQSTEYQYVAWDELTHWPDSRAYEWISLSRVRRPEGSTIPLRALSGSNPGGPGHTWVKERFVAENGPGVYIPAKIRDNPHVDQEEYVKALMRLHPTVRAQLLEGDWSARDPGDYFRAVWFGPLLDPVEDRVAQKDKISVRWWDLAASEKPDAARTAGVLMSRFRGGVRAVEHAVAFRMTPGARDAAILRQAKLDGRGVYVGLEIEGGSGGPAQFEALATTLKRHGFRVVGARPKAELRNDVERKRLMRTPIHVRGKGARADPVASCLERGHQRRGECPDTGEPWWGIDQGRSLEQERDGLRLYVGEWTQAYLDEIEGFPDAALLDFVDATSGAWTWLEAHPWGQQIPVAPATEPPAAGEQAAIHPEDRADPAESDRKYRHWRV